MAEINPIPAAAVTPTVSTVPVAAQTPASPATPLQPINTNPQAQPASPASSSSSSQAPTTQPQQPTYTAGQIVQQGNSQMVAGSDGTLRPAYNTYYAYTDPATGAKSYTNFVGDKVGDPTQGGQNTNIQIIPASQPPVSGQTPSTTPTSSGTNTPAVDAINSAISNETSSYNITLGKLNDQSDAKFNDLSAKIAQYQNGTLPLTPAQQSQIDSTTAQFNQLRQQQIIANQVYQRGVLLNEYLTGQAAPGNITGIADLQAAVNTGLQKMGEIDTKASQAIAQMEQGFQSDNLKVVQDAYSTFSSFMAQKEKALADLHTATVAAQESLRTSIQAQLQNNIVNTLNSDKFTYQQKQDAIQNQLAQAQLDEKTKVDMQNLAQKQEALNLQKKAQDFAMGLFNQANGQKPVETLPSGVANPVSQQEFLKQYSPEVQTKITGLANYSINPADFPTRLSKGQVGMTRDLAVTLAKMYDPSYDDKQYSARQKFITGWTSGGQNSVIQSANTATQHLSELYGQSEKLGNATVPLFTPGVNGIKNWIAKGSGNPNVLQFQQTAVALAGELAKIYKNGTGSNAAPTDDEIGQQLSLMTTDLAPGQYKGLIENGVKLMTDRLNSATQNYQYVMGEPPKSILFPAAMDAIKNLQNKGLNIDVSSLSQTPFDSMSSNDIANMFSSSTPSTSSSADPAAFAQLFMNMSTSAGNLAQ